MSKPPWMLKGMLLSLGLLLAPLAAAQQAVLPFAVIRDANMDIIGPVVTTRDVEAPIVRIKDPEIGVPVFLEIRETDQMLSTAGTTYFELDACEGTAYHNAEFNDSQWGFAGLTGYSYSVARRSDGAQYLFRGQLGVTMSNAAYLSRFRSSIDACEDAPEGTISTALQTMEVTNLDTDYPPNYVME